ncbi:putative sugar phosphate/phosphate translocator [Arachis hypogaea]|nr:putative sugar phosphate/phosphate translocator [Arachis hypogaea]
MLELDGSYTTKSYLEIILNRLPTIERTSTGINSQQSARLLEIIEFIQSQPDKALELGIINSRHEAFITSKLWCNNAHHDLVLSALKTTLKKLGLDYLDLYLIHMLVRLKPEVDGEMVQSEFSSEGVDFTEVNDVNNGSIGFGFHREPSFSGWCDNNGTVHLEQQRKDKDVSLEEDSDFECKSAAPIFLFLSAFAFRLETPSFKLSGIIMVISIGILLTVAKETEFELFGFILVMLAAVMSGFRWCMTQILLQPRSVFLF